MLTKSVSHFCSYVIRVLYNSGYNIGDKFNMGMIKVNYFIFSKT